MSRASSSFWTMSSCTLVFPMVANRSGPRANAARKCRFQGARRREGVPANARRTPPPLPRACLRAERTVGPRWIYRRASRGAEAESARSPRARSCGLHDARSRRRVGVEWRRNRDAPLQLREQFRPDSGNVQQILHAPIGPETLAMFHDATRQHRSDAGQRVEFGGRRAIEVDARLGARDRVGRHASGRRSGRSGAVRCSGRGPGAPRFGGEARARRAPQVVERAEREQQRHDLEPAPLGGRQRPHRGTPKTLLLFIGGGGRGSSGYGEGPEDRQSNSRQVTARLTSRRGPFAIAPVLGSSQPSSCATSSRLRAARTTRASPSVNPALAELVAYPSSRADVASLSRAPT